LGLRQQVRTDGNGRLVSFSSELNVNCALLVDRLLGLRADEQLRTVPPCTAARPHFAPELREDEQGRRWQVLDLEALTRFEPFLNIVAAAH
jgi:twitching motility protein PilI